MRIRITITFAALSVLLLTGGNVWAAPAFSSLHTFGDSLSDAGDNPSAVMSIYKILNNICDPSHPCPPYEGGRLSNGPVASEYLAESLFPGGVTTSNFRSYAVGGATSGIGNTGDIGGSATNTGTFGLPGMRQELDRFISDSGGSADPNGLYLVWGGGGDYLTHDSPVAAAQNIAGYVNTLAAAGARHILVPNL
ncbi:MAG TPA: SGNH/GDSL hydrolase family protein, partial [Nitrosospira sp.]|nr:SGNH/GDSL hydrolase family protein [Nitrosospira sp.]